MQKITLIAVLIIISLASSSQEIKHIQGAKGRYSITGDVSEETAKQKALAEAKVDALKKAGVSENIRSYDMLFKSEIGSKFEEVFMSDKQSEIRGAVQDYTAQYSKGLDEFKNFYIEVTIDASVILYKTSPDPAFNVAINGIKQGYQNNEKLTFTVIPSIDCYINIFNIYEKEASLTYPNPYEKQQFLEGGKSYTFPLNPNIDYPLEKTSKEPEKNKLVFVFTKERIPYVKYHGEDQNTSFEEVSSWLFSISPDKRYSQFVSFVIY
ncbi:MAG: DUF4384 domain-containing protein [Bacteroidales bacterium]|nr:DUF4384 domain-containing protein [Bacteroidales bacterium]